MLKQYIYKGKVICADEMCFIPKIMKGEVKPGELIDLDEPIGDDPTPETIETINRILRGEIEFPEEDQVDETELFSKIIKGEIKIYDDEF